MRERDMVIVYNGYTLHLEATAESCKFLHLSAVVLLCEPVLYCIVRPSAVWEFHTIHFTYYYLLFTY